MTIHLKQMDGKQWLTLTPYLICAYLANKLCALCRMSPDINIVAQLFWALQHLEGAFYTPFPSLHPIDLAVGILGGGALALARYLRKQDKKTFRTGIEYGSARWGTAEDIAPYTDPDPEQNIILTQSESLTMKPYGKEPKYSRNKNVLVIGGSGSGKTRFFIKPNLMQMHSSYVVTDPKGTLLVECGKMLQG